jgi:hypothetical protein
MIGPYLFELRFFFGAFFQAVLDTSLAARGKFAAYRQIDQVRHSAGDRHQFFIGLS